MARPLSLLFALATWACSCFALLLGLLWGLGLKCGDSCSSSRGWRGDPDAWQWYGVAGLGVFVFLTAGALFFFVLLRRPLLAAVAVVAGGVAAVVLTGALSTDWIDHLDRRSAGELLLLLTATFAPILAVLLSIDPASRRRPRP